MAIIHGRAATSVTSPRYQAGGVTPRAHAARRFDRYS
jgi:hypothetical protein